MAIKRDDVVQVIKGDETGKRGRVLRINRKKNRVIVEGVNYVWKHLRATRQNPGGGRLRKEAPLALANVMIVCGHCEKPCRVRSGASKEGRKVRTCVRCGKEIG